MNSDVSGICRMGFFLLALFFENCSIHMNPALEKQTSLVTSRHPHKALSKSAACYVAAAGMVQRVGRRHSSVWQTPGHARICT